MESDTHATKLKVVDRTKRCGGGGSYSPRTDSRFVQWQRLDDHDLAEHFEHDHVRRGAWRRAEIHLPLFGLSVLLGGDTESVPGDDVPPAVLVRYSRLQCRGLQPLAGQSSRFLERQQ